MLSAQQRATQPNFSLFCPLAPIPDLLILTLRPYLDKKYPSYLTFIIPRFVEASDYARRATAQIQRVLRVQGLLRQH